MTEKARIHEVENGRQRLRGRKGHIMIDEHEVGRGVE